MAPIAPAVLAAIISAAGSIGSSLISGSKSSKTAGSADNLIAQQHNDNQRWFDQRYNENYSQTAEAQNLMNYAKKEAEKAYKRADATAAVTGGTEESVARAKRGANEMLSQTASNIAAQGTARKDAIEQQYLNTKNNLTSIQVSNLQQKAQDIAGAGGIASQMFSSVLPVALEAMFKKKGA